MDTRIPSEYSIWRPVIRNKPENAFGSGNPAFEKNKSMRIATPRQVVSANTLAYGLTNALSK